jgi:hypothetical protein
MKPTRYPPGPKHSQRDWLVENKAAAKGRKTWGISIGKERNKKEKK